MAEPTPRTSPNAEELAWLSSAPPSDDEGRPVAWILRDRSISECSFSDPIVHEGMTLVGVGFDAFNWSGATFRRCKFHSVDFRRCTFENLRFEYVLFERCTFDRVTFTGCHFDRTTIGASELAYVKMREVELHNSQLLQLDASVIEMRDCSLSATPIRDSKLGGLSASSLSGDALSLERGELRKSDLTDCRLDALQLDAVEVDGLALFDCKLERVSLQGARVKDVSLHDCTSGTVELGRANESVNITLAGGRIGELRIDTCSPIALVMVADCQLGRLSAKDSLIFDANFERVTSTGESRVEGGALVGASFTDGSWAELALSGTKIERYLSARGTRFEALALTDAVPGHDLRTELEGETYGDGSMTWGELRGT